MFTRGIEALLDALPELQGLDETAIRRLLSRAWLEVAERRELAGSQSDEESTSSELRRLATALQVHAVLVVDLDPVVVRACSFVAAEALDIARELGDLDATADTPIEHERVLVGLLYLIAGYDSNADVAVRGVEVRTEASDAERYALESMLAMLSGGPLPNAPEVDDADGYLHDRVRAALWRTVGDAFSEFTHWLRNPTRPDTDQSTRLLQLADLLRLSEDDLPIVAHADIQHLARTASRAFVEASGRALRQVPPPAEHGGAFSDFLASRCAVQPLLWPAAADYVRAALPGPTVSAIVAVPTGAGKSGVADLAVQHAIVQGWVLYLAPTNALVGQIRRQLRRDHPGITVREFLGGAEYTSLAGEELEEIKTGEILVMTPEKCSLALRQSPDAFGELALVVFDEAHLLGERRGRGTLTELVLADILSRANRVALLLMSALIANPDDLASWLRQAHDRDVVVIREPWRPTRTLRAVVGIDRQTTLDAAQEPALTLQAMPPRRRNVKFDASLAVLAGLQGPWSTREAADYALVRIGATTPMNVTRPAGGGTIRIDPQSANTRATVESLAQLLGERNQKVMAFLPRSKHDSFAAGLSLPGFGAVNNGATVRSLLALAGAELGVESLLGAALSKGVAVHTSALLTEERRASELAFDEGNALVLFATGTLAQGLNLPATTVIIGGTDIGYDPEQTEAEKRQQRSQLLNAIGRAGRARVSARSLALVVPTRMPLLDATTLVDAVLPRAEFLSEEDASTQLSSSLRALLVRVRDGTVDPDKLTGSDHLALAYLVPADDSGDAGSVLRRSWGAYQAGGITDVTALVATIGQIGEQQLESNGGPTWAAEAGRRAGVALPISARFATTAVKQLGAEDVPESVDDWLDLMLDALATIPVGQLGLLLSRDAFRSTPLEGMWSEQRAESVTAHRAMRETLRRWLAGESLAAVGGAAHGTGPIQDPGRGQQDPIPRTIRLIESGIGFGLTRAAGLLAASVDVAVENGAGPSLQPAAQAALERLPISLRVGASDRTALGFIRAGARPRAVAHLLAERIGPAPEGTDDDGIRQWASDRLFRLPDHLDLADLTQREQQLVTDYLVSIDAR